MSRGFRWADWNTFLLGRLVSPPIEIPSSIRGMAKRATLRVGLEMSTVRSSRSSP